MNIEALHQSKSGFRDEQYRALGQLANHRLLDTGEERHCFQSLERALREWIKVMARSIDQQRTPYEVLSEEEWLTLKSQLDFSNQSKPNEELIDKIRSNFPCINALRSLTLATESQPASQLMAEVDTLVDFLVTHNQKLVIKVAKEHNFLSLPLVDLVQEGNIGLLKAIEKYDVKREHKFSTYAWWWIRHSITLYVRKQGGLVRKPDNLVEQMLQVLREFEHAGEYQSREKLNQVARKQHLPPKKVERLLQLAKPDLSIDAPLSSEDSDLSLAPLLVAQDSAIDDIVITRNSLSKHLNQLPEVLRKVLVLRFGLEGSPPQSFREIGNVLGRSAERCRQMTHEALMTLKEVMTVK